MSDKYGTTRVFTYKMTRIFYPPTLENKDLNPAWMQFQFYERRSARDVAADDEVLLYMPESASNPSTVSWDTEKFGYIGNAIAQGAKNVKNWNQVNIDGIIKGATEAGTLGAYRGLANLGSSAAQLLNGNVSAEGLIGEVTGKTLNPYLTMVFKGIDFRSFAFVFKFVPFSEKDCETIDKIIKTFRGNALSPQEKQGDPFLGYPKECEISYMWKNDRNKWLNRFKTAVCTAVDVDYTPSGMFSTMRNGFPSQIVMSTKWSEIKIVTREDVMKNGY